MAHGSKWYITAFAGLLAGLMVLGERCVQGSNPVLNEMVQTASIMGHELKTGVHPIFKAVRASRCCSLWPPTWSLESCTGVHGASLDLQPFDTEAVFRQAWFCSCDFCHKISVCVVLACCHSSCLSRGGCVTVWSEKCAAPLNVLSDFSLLSNTNVCNFYFKRLLHFAFVGDW